MAKLKEATEWLRSGKKVRRSCWKEGSYWTLGIDESITWNDKKEAIIHLNQLEADDYEVFEEEFETLKDIDDFDNYRMYSVREFREKLRQEAIKWVKKKRYKIEEDDWMEFFNIVAEELKDE